MKRIKVLVAIVIITILTFAGCAKMSEKAENVEENKYGANALECLTSDNYAYPSEYRDKEMPTEHHMLIKIRAFGKEAIKNEKGESWKFWNLCKMPSADIVDKDHKR